MRRSNLCIHSSWRFAFASCHCWRALWPFPWPPLASLWPPPSFGASPRGDQAATCYAALSSVQGPPCCAPTSPQEVHLLHPQGPSAAVLALVKLWINVTPTDSTLLTQCNFHLPWVGSLLVGLPSQAPKGSLGLCYVPSLELRQAPCKNISMVKQVHGVSR